MLYCFLSCHPANTKCKHSVSFVHNVHSPLNIFYTGAQSASQARLIQEAHIDSSRFCPSSRTSNTSNIQRNLCIPCYQTLHPTQFFTGLLPFLCPSKGTCVQNIYNRALHGTQAHISLLAQPSLPSELSLMQPFFGWPSCFLPFVAPRPACFALLQSRTRLSHHNTAI